MFSSSMSSCQRFESWPSSAGRSWMPGLLWRRSHTELLKRFQQAGWLLWKKRILLDYCHVSADRLRFSWSEAATLDSLGQIELRQGFKGAHRRRHTLQLVVVEVEDFQWIPQDFGKLDGTSCQEEPRECRGVKANMRCTAKHRDTLITSHRRPRQSSCGIERKESNRSPVTGLSEANISAWSGEKRRFKLVMKVANGRVLHKMRLRLIRDASVQKERSNPRAATSSLPCLITRQPPGLVCIIKRLGVKIGSILPDFIWGLTKGSFHGFCIWT